MIIIDINDFAIIKYIIYYCNVLQMMRFLFDHESFQKDLNYFSMNVKRFNDSRVYNEMHIKNLMMKEIKRTIHKNYNDFNIYCHQ